MLILTTITLLFILLLTYLTIRELRHKPLSFTVYFPHFKPTLASHRGFGKHGPIAENTLPAFLASEKLGFTMHEFDVRRTIDNEVMLLHGPRLEVTSDGKGRMEEHTLSTIKTLDAGFYTKKNINPKKYKPTPFATLREVLTKLPKKTKFNIEIKRDRWDFSKGVEDLTVRVVTYEGVESRVCFSGFHFLTLWHLRRFRTKVPIGLLIEKSPFALLKLHLYRFLLLPDNIHLDYKLATPKLMASLKRRGYGLAFWTVNDAAIVNDLFAHGADVVITDNMELV
ncbi:MAG: Glycerophosphodiester phosphodiesterase, cytoplasmic [Turneriella sp.]|nr:Glycerophosphodiester phosphodiesterase, cytoplasmic [Turneriella sp.]